MQSKTLTDIAIRNLKPGATRCEEYPIRVLAASTSSSSRPA